jgi:hypothetical protein
MNLEEVRKLKEKAKVIERIVTEISRCEDLFEWFNDQENYPVDLCVVFQRNRNINLTPIEHKKFARVIKGILKDRKKQLEEL